ncbi:MAG: triose-phosphate isomerase [Candidatus Aenigmatarchaeota archaeon]|nr:MAG: triose-phosphate isomerase [Thermoplasmata archaeon]RLI97588.1 MAG: triose-phosphate isomerase [Candidatus Aenigmarchaeota archaeon]
MTMRKPIIIVNMKTYLQSIGEKAIKLAKSAAKVSEKTGAEIILAPQLTDLKEVAKIVPAYSQHIDPIEPGAHTGHVLGESLKDAGATGVIINHSEDVVPFDDIKKNIEKARSLGLTTVVCAPSAIEAEEIAKFSPDFIAVEPPELIGGDISVSTAKPELIEETVKGVHKVNPNIKVLCGAGVKTGKDVKKAMELGAEGILVASGVVKAEDPEAALMDLSGACVEK